MTRLSRSAVLVTVLVTLFSGTALAELSLNGVGVLQQYCADGEDTPHPGLLIMRQIMMTDDLATLGGTLFAVVYESESPPEQTGKLVVRVRIQRTDGSREKIGKFVAYQQEDGSAESDSWFPVAVRMGDTVIWRYNFRNFEGLTSDDCLLLIGATLRP